MSKLQHFSTTPLQPVKGNPLPSFPPPEKALKRGPGRFPEWLHRKLPSGPKSHHTHNIVEKYGLNTVCEEAKCPNLTECYSHKTATFLAMGSACTRSCSFCDIDHSSTPPPLDSSEPQKIALATQALGLKHVVITMVARDDLEDGGVAHLKAILNTIHNTTPTTTTELLTSDFEGKVSSWQALLDTSPAVFNHNVETVERLSPFVRHKATYPRSLAFLRFLSDHGYTTKSGIMVGLGEEKKEVFQTLKDLKNQGVKIVTIGQYLQANRKKRKVSAFIPPSVFKEYEAYGLSIGIKKMFCGPFIRSSYHAGEQFLQK